MLELGLPLEFKHLLLNKKLLVTGLRALLPYPFA